MSLRDKILAIYPELQSTPEIFCDTIVLQDDGDGNAYIAQWLHPTLPAPTADQIVDAVPMDFDRLAEIKRQLDEIDRRSIRAIRAGEADRLAALEVEAAALRTELSTLTGEQA